MKLFLIHADESKQEFGIGDSVQSLIRAIRRGEIETIVAGDVKDGTVLWEKQFQAVTVMPASFGAKGSVRDDD